MPRVLFLNPPGPRYLYRGTVCTYLSKARYVWKPKDFILMSGRVPVDWEARFVDAAIRRLDAEETLRRASEAAPDRIVLALSSIHWEEDLAFLRRLREAQPKAHLTVFGEVLLEAGYRAQAEPLCDAVLFNPVQYDVGSTTFPGQDTEPQKAGQEVRLGLPRHDLFDYWRYRWPFNRHFRYAAVYTQYGCPYSCSYCTESITSVAYRSAESVLEELRMLRRAGYRELHLGDASFGFPKSNAVRLLQGMVDQRLGFSWSCYTYPALADRDMLALMKASGCHTVVIGIDSANTDLLRKYGRRLSTDRLERFLADCRSLGIDVCGDFILGFDEDTKDSIRQTVDLALRSQLAYASINIATPLFGSSLREKAMDERRLAGRANGFDTAGNSILGNVTIGPETLRRMRREANRAFYLRPGYLWRRLRSVQGPQHLAIQALEAAGLLENYFRHLLGTNASPRPGE
jgi:hypothetical protein